MNSHESQCSSRAASNSSSSPLAGSRLQNTGRIAVHDFSKPERMPIFPSQQQSRDFSQLPQGYNVIESSLSHRPLSISTNQNTQLEAQQNRLNGGTKLNPFVGRVSISSANPNISSAFFCAPDHMKEASSTPAMRQNEIIRGSNSETTCSNWNYITGWNQMQTAKQVFPPRSNGCKYGSKQDSDGDVDIMNSKNSGLVSSGTFGHTEETLLQPEPSLSESLVQHEFRSIEQILNSDGSSPIANHNSSSDGMEIIERNQAMNVNLTSGSVIDRSEDVSNLSENDTQNIEILLEHHDNDDKTNTTNSRKKPLKPKTLTEKSKKLLADVPCTGTNRSPKNLKRRFRTEPESVFILKKWVADHIAHPYPNAKQKEILCKETNLPMRKLEVWLTNYRQRKLKDMMRQRRGAIAQKELAVTPSYSAKQPSLVAHNDRGREEEDYGEPSYEPIIVHVSSIPLGENDKSTIVSKCTSKERTASKTDNHTQTKVSNVFLSFTSGDTSHLLSWPFHSQNIFRTLVRLADSDQSFHNNNHASSTNPLLSCFANFELRDSINCDSTQIESQTLTNTFRDDNAAIAISTGSATLAKVSVPKKCLLVTSFGSNISLAMVNKSASVRALSICSDTGTIDKTYCHFPTVEEWVRSFMSNDQKMDDICSRVILQVPSTSRKYTSCSLSFSKAKQVYDCVFMPLSFYLAEKRNHLIDDFDEGQLVKNDNALESSVIGSNSFCEGESSNDAVESTGHDTCSSDVEVCASPEDTEEPEISGNSIDSLDEAKTDAHTEGNSTTIIDTRKYNNSAFCENNDKLANKEHDGDSYEASFKSETSDVSHCMNSFPSGANEQTDESVSHLKKKKLFVKRKHQEAKNSIVSKEQNNEPLSLPDSSTVHDHEVFPEKLLGESNVDHKKTLILSSQRVASSLLVSVGTVGGNSDPLFPPANPPKSISKIRSIMKHRINCDKQFQASEFLQRKVRHQIKSQRYLRTSVRFDHPNAPLSEAWISCKATETPGIDSGGSLLGRKWVWDEGYYTDSDIDHFSTRDVRKSLPVCETPLNCRAYCNCGAEKEQDKKSEGGRSRRSAGNSVKLSHVMTELASGKLNPHTLIQCESYPLGPEMERLASLPDEVPATDALRKLIRDKGGKTSVQPFSVRVSPDAVFLADLHAHLADCEVIGLLGGRWVSEEKCVYIQAAFPCKAADSGSTDVEMDPVSQVMARDAISAHGMKVLGWYHSHPTFQPDPSVTDIENQGNYQRLFGTGNDSDGENDVQGWTPFVGLIIGTWDPRNPSSRSVMRWFHVTPKETGNTVSARNQSSVSSSYIDFSKPRRAVKEKVLFPMTLRVTYRRFRSDDMIDNKTRDELTSSGLRYRTECRESMLAALREKRQGEIDIWEHRGSLSSIKKKEIASSKSSFLFCQVIKEEESSTMEEKSHTQSRICHESNSSRRPSHDSLSTSQSTSLKNNKNVEKREVAKNSDGDEVVKLCMPPDPLAAFAYSVYLTHESFSRSGRQSKVGADEAITTLICPSDKDDSRGSQQEIILISNSLVDAESSDLTEERQVNTSRKRKSSSVADTPAALPLPFVDEEFDILNNRNSVDDEDLAKIIWTAVEREQYFGMKTLSSMNPDSSWVSNNIHMHNPASSQSIKNLLLSSAPYIYDKESMMDRCDEDRKTGSQDYSSKEYTIDNMILINGIDALFTHYASNKKRVDMRDTWNGGGVGMSNANGNIISSIYPGGPGNRIRKGQKLCASLLQWSRNMQLSPFSSDQYETHDEKDRDSMNYSIYTPSGFDENESNLSDDNNIHKFETRKGDESRTTTAGADVIKRNASYDPGGDLKEEEDKISAVVDNGDEPCTSRKSVFTWDHEEKETCSQHVGLNGYVYSSKKNTCRFDHDSTCVQFIAEVMRLLAAQWREHRTPRKVKGRRGRPRKKFKP